MNDSISTFEKEVLQEFILEAKSTSWLKTSDMVDKQLKYDLEFGEGESIELLNKYFYQILDQENLTQDQIKKLAETIIRREGKWDVESDITKFNVNDIIEDGYGYVILSGWHRFDIEPVRYREEREAYNKKRDERLRTQKTNGKEYLK